MAEKRLSGQQSRRRRGPTPKSRGLWVYLAEDEREFVEQARLILAGTANARKPNSATLPTAPNSAVTTWSIAHLPEIGGTPQLPPGAVQGRHDLVGDEAHQLIQVIRSRGVSIFRSDAKMEPAFCLFSQYSRSQLHFCGNIFAQPLKVFGASLEPAPRCPRQWRKSACLSSPSQP